jgi:tetratricopeptide (TPR) repeat protein
VNLNRLSNRESLAMVSHLLNEAEIHEDLEAFILEKVEGVPFFIEEFMRSLMDLKVIERKDNQYLFARDFLEMTIPSTIQDVILARVDSLPEGAKEVIQTGAVIEREFSYELIKKVMGLSEKDLLSRLSILKDTELLYERGIYPDTTYIFKHALTCETVYNSILSRNKKKLHENIGNAIEDLYKENIGEHYGVLAEHFICSENYKKGAEYSKLAGKKAEKKASINDAIAYAKKRVASLERLPRTDDLQKMLIDARTVLGLYFIQLNLMVEAKEAVSPIIDSAKKLGYKRRLSQIYTVMGAYYSYEDDLLKAFEYLENALRIAEELNDIPSLAFANTFMGVACSYNCEHSKALHYTEKALEINVAGNVLWGIASMKTHLVLMYLGHGKVGLAYENSAEILQIADESSDIYSKMQAHEALSHSCFYKGFFEEAKEHLSITSDLAERLNIFSIAGWASQCLGETYFVMGEYKKSQKYNEKAISLLQMGRILPSHINFSKMLISRAKVMNNEKDIDINEILKWHEEYKIKRLEGSMLNCIGSILLNIDDQRMNEAEDWIKKAIEANDRNGMMWHLAQDYALYADFYKRKNDLSKSRENLNKSIEILKECGADGWVERYEKELASLS